MLSRFAKPLPPLNAAQILKAHGLRADKSLGQNFLQDPYALEKIVAAAEIRPTDAVLEIGPGLGALTRHLAAAAGQVAAVELDGRLILVLQEVLTGYTNVKIVRGDVLSLPLAEIVPATDYLVVANIPYYITSALLRRLLETTPRPRRVVLTVQKEVAERICAGPGDMSLLALSVQVYGTPRVVTTIPAGAFYPAPKVDSAVVRMDSPPAPFIPYSLLDTFFALAKAGFSQKRKTLRNSLSAGLRKSPAEAESLLRAAGIDPMRRAETLSLEEWRELTARA
ncbi:MAG: 16S rRNA (adenine(1518)-N(6)/adenine(1519)-N(6))-dimethyltransferase RsmA [Anaerolineales bacterium]|nr:16S rRNA (adenine(1518)-N(6)/adenine(1519)-N(6))-dimethyltransferase RsmA [Anaerolineales bacterium]